MTVTAVVLLRRGLTELADLPGVHVVWHELGRPLDEEARGAEILVAEGASTEEVVALAHALPSLRVLQTTNAGTEQWEGRLPGGVVLSNGRGAHGASTAEWAVAALLAVYRQLVRFSQQRTWDTRSTETLKGKRVLVLGAGDLGTEIRVRLEAFAATATLVGRTARDGVRALEEVPELLGAHDAVVLVVPLTEKTRHLVDAAFLARMRDGAVLVNAARGGVVDTDALVAELGRGRLRAALDVTEPEPLPAGHPLWTAPGVLITPHVGGYTEGREDRAWAVARENVAAVGRGEQPPNAVR